MRDERTPKDVCGEVNAAMVYETNSLNERGEL